MKIAEKVLAFVVCLVLGGFLSCASSIEQQTVQPKEASVQQNLEQIASIAKAATVQVGSLSVEGPPMLGSGFFIRHDLVVTNIHVVNQKSFDGAVSMVKLVNKPTWYTVKSVMASDPKRDLVILKVAKVGGEDPHILSLADSDTVKVGDKIVAIGSPKQGDKFVQGDVSMGTVDRRTPYFFSMKTRNVREGYSGGPVLNVHGDVIGITFQSHRIGTGYAIPSNHLQALFKRMTAQAESLEKWREDPLIRYYSAVDAANRGELASAIKDYDTAIHVAPDFADAYINRGYARKKLGDLKGAIEDYDTAIRLGDDYAYVYLNRGVAKFDLEDYKGAIEDYDTAIRLDSEYVDAILRRADVKSDLKDYKGAIEDYDTAIRFKPENDLLTAAYYKRGDAKSDLEDYKGAIEDYDTVIRSKPEGAILALAYLNRGSAMSALGDNEGAIEDCDTTIRLKPVDILLAAAYNVRGEAKSAQDDDKGSIIDYDKAIQLEPDYAEFYYNRGVANASLGRTAEAEADFKTALKLLDQTIRISQSVEGETFSELHLGIRSDLKADIEDALRHLE